MVIIMNLKMLLTLVSYVTSPDDADADATNEIQVLSISNDTLFLSDGGFAVLPKDKVEDADADSDNERIQSVELNGTTLEIMEGGRTFSVDLGPLMDAAYLNGFNDGKAAGYEEGVAESYDVGYNDGYSDGETIGYSLGYDDG